MKIILFGSPGSGKGTQAIMLSEYLTLPRISLGDILREEVKKGSELGKEVKQSMEEGVLVPDSIVLRVVESRIDPKGFILDGYPRNLSQAEKLQEIIEKDNNDIDFFIYLDIDQKTIIDRLSKRRVCKSCGVNYHLENMPSKVEGICDHCAGDLIQRDDDKPEVIKRRWEVFSGESHKIIKFYKDKGKAYEIEGRGDKDEIFNRIKVILK